MDDRIEVRGLRAVGVHGLLPEERDRAQPFELDLDIETDLRDAGRSDDLADTIDYGHVVQVAAGVVTNERHALLERVAARVAEEILRIEGVRSVRVTVRKLRPPIPVDVATTAVSILRRR